MKDWASYISRSPDLYPSLLMLDLLRKSRALRRRLREHYDLPTWARFVEDFNIPIP